MEVVIFWCAIIFLLLFSFAFFLPWIRAWRFRILLAVLFSLLTLTVYFKLGNSRYLTGYYSNDEKALRKQQGELQQSLAVFRKLEYHLRTRLLENPNDIDAHWRLLDVLAIKALQHNNTPLALQYWKEAVNKIPAIPANAQALYRMQLFIKEQEK